MASPGAIPTGMRRRRESSLRFFPPASWPSSPSACLSAIVLAFVFARHDLAYSEAAQALPGSHADYSFWWLVNYYGEAPTWTIVILACLTYLASFVSGRLEKALARYRPHLTLPSPDGGPGAGASEPRAQGARSTGPAPATASDFCRCSRSDRRPTTTASPAGIPPPPLSCWPWFS